MSRRLDLKGTRPMEGPQTLAGNATAPLHSVPLQQLQSYALTGGGVVAYPPGYLFGLTLSNDGTSPNTVIDIAAGNCRDTSDTDNMVLGAFTKTTGAWAAGTGNGGLDTGAVANSTWYHVYVIKTAGGSGGTTDVLISTSATAPTMPGGYTLKRRIGSILTDGSAHIVAFKQLGDEFLWSSPAADTQATNPGTSAVTRNLTVPTGLQVWARCRCSLSQGDANNGHLLITSFDEADRVPAAVAGDFDASVELASGLSQIAVADKIVRTNINAQVRSRVDFSNANTLLRIATYGWIDARGRQY